MQKKTIPVISPLAVYKSSFIFPRRYLPIYEDASFTLLDVQFSILVRNFCPVIGTPTSPQTQPHLLAHPKPLTKLYNPRDYDR